MYEEIAEKIKAADGVLIGASNGLSITEGLHIFSEGEDFVRVFGDFRQKYGIANILGGVFFKWRSENEKWAFLSRLLTTYMTQYTPSPVMKSLLKIVSDKPYFIVTSNGENHFELAGCEPRSIFEIEGSWKYMRCGAGCCDELYPTTDAVRKMAAAEHDCRVPDELVPRCPHCGAPMDINFYPLHERAEAYREFVNRFHGKKLVILELGIGARNRLIKLPLMQLAYREENAFYVTFNKGEIYIPQEIRAKSVGADGDLGEILPEIAAMM